MTALTRTAADARRRLLAADEELLVRVGRMRAPFATRVMRAFTRLGDTESWVAIGLVLLAAGGPGPGLAWRLLVSAGLGALIAQPVKRLTARRRPHVRIQGFETLADIPDAFSFPSGHTATAVAVAVAFSGHGDFLGTLTAMLAVGIGTSRVYLGAHYPLDVLAGAGLGALAGIAARTIVG
ncbi:MAG TPA: phosphatase PAP2 family protein [bacterium]|nr:phosphatase PAP2 family protein [bacterium]